MNKEKMKKNPTFFSWTTAANVLMKTQRMYNRRSDLT